MPLSLSERQQNAVAAAVTILAALIIVAAIGGFFWLAAAFLQRFANVVLPLAVAGVAALVFNPYYEWLRRRLHLPTAAAVAVVFLSVLLPFVAFFWFFGAILVDQASDVAHRIPQWWRSTVAELQKRWPEVQRFLD
ncbi:MAG: AI-2E family transporter, partial [Acidobacteria bacterium]|nr:AI-2E family transporter [Acidobacteriota bacterium]